MTKRKAQPQVLGGIKIIHTVWEPIQDPEQALKEANANRLARAKFDQAMKTTTDPGVRQALLKVADDGTAGAALLRYAAKVLVAKRREEALQAHNKAKQRARDAKDKQRCAVVDQIRAKNPRLTKTGAAKNASKQLNVSYRTISKALDRRGEALKKDGRSFGPSI